MLVPVYEPPTQVDSTNVADFSARIAELITRYGAVVVDCSDVALIGPSAMRVLRIASRDGKVTLVHPSPRMKLMAAAYGFDVDLPDSRDASDTADAWRLSPTPRPGVGR
jgi:anti-anti-sigma regulatory factor